MNEREPLDPLVDQFIKKVSIKPEDLKKNAGSLEPSLLLLESGSNFGHFRISRSIGSGAIGEVYLAQDTTLQREIALKIMTKATAQDIERFYREARIAAKLDHPNIVHIYEIGKINDHYYISMQYIKGKNLEDSRPTIEQALQMVVIIARALDYAHSRGIIHRDIKPSNILVDEFVKPYLVDFGIAKSVISSEKTISVTGMIIGTPAFMSPEQASGQASDVNYLSDIYSIGATLYYLVTGSQPYMGRTAMETIENILHEEPVEPRKLNPRIPKDVEAIIMKAMERKQLKRYASAGDLADDIVRCLKGEPIKAKRTSPITRVYKKAKRHKIKLALFGLFVLIALVATYSIIDKIRAQKVLQEATELMLRAEGFINEFDDLFFLPAGDLTSKIDLLDNAIKESEKVIRLTQDQLADPYYIIAKSLIRKLDYEGALNYINKAISISKQSRFIYERAKIYSAISNDLALKIYDEDILKAKQDDLKIKRINGFKEVISKADIDRFKMLEAESQVAILEKDDRKIQDVLKKIGAELDLTNDHKIRLLLYSTKAGLLASQGFLDEAIEFLDKSIDIARGSVGIFQTRGFYHFLKGQRLLEAGYDPIPEFDKAIADYNTALSISSNKYLYYGAIAHINTSKVDYLMSLGKDPSQAISEAERYCQKAIEKDPGGHEIQYLRAKIFYQKSFLMPDPVFELTKAAKICEKIIQEGLSYSEIHLFLGEIYFEKYSFTSQEGDFTSSLNGFQNAMQKDPVISEECYKSIAGLYIKKAEANISNEPLDEIEKIISYTEKLDADSKDYSYNYHHVHSLKARILYNRKDKNYIIELEKSLEYLDRIVKIGEVDAGVLINRAQTLIILGRNKEAIADLEYALKLAPDIRMKKMIDSLLEQYIQSK